MTKKTQQIKNTTVKKKLNNYKITIKNMTEDKNNSINFKCKS